MFIKKYELEDEVALFKLIEKEGTGWAEYYDTRKEHYQKALVNSITYVVYDENLCGYCRCRDDDGFGIYIYDLLIEKGYRGKQYGRALMQQVKYDYPEADVYVMSDVDVYYQKQGFSREGSIFAVDF